MKLRFTPRATQSLVEIADYIRERNPAAMLRVRADIYDGLQNLLLFPKAGRQQNKGGVRKLVTLRYAYLIYYVVEETADEIVVVDLKHHARGRGFEDA